MSIIGEYLSIVKKYTEKYGERLFVLFQVGSFFEVYALKDDVSELSITAFANVCQLNIADKQISFNDKQVVMAGFRDYALYKYLQKITSEDYTAVVYVQEKEKDKQEFKRVFHSIHSPGTFIPQEDNMKTSNNIMCVWIEQFNQIRGTKNLVCGISNINIFTGESFLFEYQTPYTINPTSFDELERCVSTFTPNEVILISPFEKDIVKNIIQFSNIKCHTIHTIHSETDTKSTNCSNQKYINEILSCFYGEDAINTCLEFSSYITATQSFCYLLNFMQEHNPNLVRKIHQPVFNNVSNRLILANHTLKQLNIIEDSKKNGLSSVSSFINKCGSSMGKRMLQSQITNPTFDEEWLNSQYNTISIILQNEKMIDDVRSLLVKVCDIEKILRQLIVNKLFPSVIYSLYKTIETVLEINKILEHYPEIFTIQSFSSILEFLNEYLYIEDCKDIRSTSIFEKNIIKPTISKTFDVLLENNKKNENNLQDILVYFNKLMGIQDCVKIHETEKSGVSLQITKKRGITLKGIISKMDVLVISQHLKIKSKDVVFKSVSKTTDEIVFDFLEEICRDMLIMKDKINQEGANVYNNIFLKTLETKWFNTLENLSKYVGNLDVILCKAYIARKYNYCCPVINSSSEKSFVETYDLRHCLIEHIQQNELYVSNDILLGKDTDGILLYGTNAVGKTSLIRALGISVILAQSGMFVPCSKFIYKPYTAIYSRILGNDNIFKGLSTFAVEMSELRVILRMADENSLILGDELCSGTENESALSIFVAGLTHLHDIHSSFIFATHFHEIVDYDEIKNMNKLCLKHLTVFYDRENDCLIYDRKLKDGSGDKMYGLEVCSSLHMPEDFLEMAYSLRTKYFSDTKGQLSRKTSVYNSQKIIGMCEICNIQIGEEIHHLIPQKMATEKGFIVSSVHKNHKANLISICEKCHIEIHTKKKRTYNKKKTTKGYKLVFIE